jgi:hypothetical protein
MTGRRDIITGTDKPAASVRHMQFLALSKLAGIPTNKLSRTLSFVIPPTCVKEYKSKLYLENIPKLVNCFFFNVLGISTERHCENISTRECLNFMTEKKHVSCISLFRSQLYVKLRHGTLQYAEA